jgi:hypothetical protein
MSDDVPDAAAALDDIAPVAMHRSPSTVMHELNHLVWKARMWTPSSLEDAMRGKDLLKAVRKNLIEAPGVHEAYADVAGAAYTKSWRIGMDSAVRDVAAGLDFDGKPLLRTYDELERAAQPVLDMFDQYGPEFAILSDDAIPLPSPHKSSGILSLAALEMQPAIGWERLDRLFFESMGDLERADNGSPTIRAAAASLDRTAERLWGARSAERRAVREALEGTKALAKPGKLGRIISGAIRLVR